MATVMANPKNSTLATTTMAMTHGETAIAGATPPNSKIDPAPSANAPPAVHTPRPAVNTSMVKNTRPSRTSSSPARFTGSTANA
jgi:hypothetical protein